MEIDPPTLPVHRGYVLKLILAAAGALVKREFANYSPRG